MPEINRLVMILEAARALNHVDSRYAEIRFRLKKRW